MSRDDPEADITLDGSEHVAGGRGSKWCRRPSEVNEEDQHDPGTGAETPP